jgi:hypothetical protein
MAFLNEFKKRSIRKTKEYQTVMADLVEIGVVPADKAQELIDRWKPTVSQGISAQPEPERAPADTPAEPKTVKVQTTKGGKVAEEKPLPGDE